MLGAIYRLWCGALLVLFLNSPAAAAAKTYHYSGEAWRCQGAGSSLSDFCSREEKTGEIFQIQLTYTVQNPGLRYQFYFEKSESDFKNLGNLTNLELSLDGYGIFGIKDLLEDVCVNPDPWSADSCAEGALWLDLEVRGATGSMAGRVADHDLAFDFYWGRKGGRGTYTVECCGPCDQHGDKGHMCSFEFFATVAEPATEISFAAAVAILIAHQLRLSNRFQTMDWRPRRRALRPGGRQ